MNPGDVRKLERARARADRRHEEARRARDEGIVAARKQGWPLAEIAREIGTTTQYVSKILRETSP